MSIDHDYDYENVKNYYEPYTKWPACDVIFTKLPEKYSVDLDALRQDIHKLFVSKKLFDIRFTKNSRDEEIFYRGIGLSHNNKQIDDYERATLIYDKKGNFFSSGRVKNMDPAVFGKNLLRYNYDRDFSYLNSETPRSIIKLIKNFKSPFTKIRIAQLEPGGMVPPHWDYPYYEEIRLHLVLESNSDVIWRVENSVFKIPADGHMYFFDTGRVHSVFNGGQTSRSVLSIHLSPYYSRDNKLMRSEFIPLSNMIRNHLL